MVGENALKEKRLFSYNFLLLQRSSGGGGGGGAYLRGGLNREFKLAFKRENVLRPPICHFCVREQSQLTKMEFFYLALFKV